MTRLNKFITKATDLPLNTETMNIIKLQCSDAITQYKRRKFNLYRRYSTWCRRCQIYTIKNKEKKTS